MRKQTGNPLNPDNFSKFTLVLSAGLGVPLALSLLPRALGYGDPELHWKRARIVLLPTAFCAVTGWLLLRLVYWPTTSDEEE